MLRLLLCIALLLVAGGLVGCSGGVKEKQIEIKEKSSLDEAKQVLQNYANGAPLSSEVDSFPDLVNRVKAEDEAKATIVEDAFKKIQESPSKRQSIARETLKKL